jgi:hypothetical protein
MRVFRFSVYTFNGGGKENNFSLRALIVRVQSLEFSVAYTHTDMKQQHGYRPKGNICKKENS